MLILNLNFNYTANNFNIKGNFTPQERPSYGQVSQFEVEHETCSNYVEPQLAMWQFTNSLETTKLIMLNLVS